MINTKAIVSVLLVFIFGAISGALVTRVINHGHFESSPRGDHPPREEHIVKQLTSKLDLNKQQQDQVRLIIHDSEQAIQQIRSQSRPQIEGVLNEGQKRISVLLTPEQRITFEKIIAERKSRRHGHDH